MEQIYTVDIFYQLKTLNLSKFIIIEANAPYKKFNACNAFPTSPTCFCVLPSIFRFKLNQTYRRIIKKQKSQVALSG
jgi:hypothetical protein